MSFSSDMARFNKKVEKRLNIVFRKAAFDVSKLAILRTPVDSGRARANWVTAINSYSSATSSYSGDSGIDAPAPSGGSAEALKGVSSTVGELEIGDRFTLVNNLPYIGKLENGSSRQAAAGMVAVSVAEYQQIVRKALKQI